MKKCQIRAKWKAKGLNMENFDDIYERYIKSTNCELCNKKYKSTKDRCMDHCHKTGEFRNVVCQKCNNNKFDRKPCGKLNELYITERNRSKKLKNGNYYNYTIYVVRIVRDGKNVLNKERMNLQDAIDVRNNYINTH